MVRVKTRWILLRLDYAEHFGSLNQAQSDAKESQGSNKKKQQQFPSSRDLFFAIHDSHIQNFGVAASGQAHDIQVRFCDPQCRLALLRISRRDQAQIRATLTLMTSMLGRRAVLTIVSIHGNVRTAKQRAIQEVHKIYRTRLKQLAAAATSSNKKNDASQIIQKECFTFHATLETLLGVEF